MLLYTILTAALAGAGFCSVNNNPLGRSSNITENLGPLLSSGAYIVLRGTTEFQNLTTRWVKYKAPNVDTVVVVANENDVQETVRYANLEGIPIVAFTGGHGSIESLAEIKNGIQVHLRKLSHISIDLDGNTATIGGGTKVKEVTSTLWAHYKQTVTGGCECVGMTAPALGGGHGILQGYHGLLADQIISARLVLANGTAVTVSNNDHPDLYWALRGAGHNFGIVTELTYRIYDANPNETWSYEILTFTSDKLEELYRLTNEYVPSQPAQLLNFGLFINMPDIDSHNPVIFYYMLYDGPKAILQRFTAPFHNLKPVSVTEGEGSYPDMPAVLQFSDRDIACQPSESVLRFPVYMKSYNVSAMRILFDEFAKGMKQQPAFNTSFFLVEGYSQQGVHAVPAESTAFPHRSERLLLAPCIYYPLDSSLDNEAVSWGQKMRQIMYEGTGERDLHAYVNYAHGDESQEALYGAEVWRIERLRQLKQRYDPLGKFSYYAPLSLSSDHSFP